MVSQEQGAATLRSQQDERQADLERSVENDPLVQAVLRRFPGATIGTVTQKAPDAEGELPDMPPAEDED